MHGTGTKSLPVFILEKAKKARDAWQHLGKSVPPWEIPPGADPGHPKWSKGSPGQRLGHKSLHKSLWDLLGKGGKPRPSPAVMRGLLAQGWSWVPPVASQFAVGIQVSIPSLRGAQGGWSRTGRARSAPRATVTRALALGAPGAQHHGP